jgi:hypothetical protein
MRANRLCFLSLLTLGVLGPAQAAAAEPGPTAAPSVADETGHRRLLDLEVHPLFSFPDALGLCVEVFPLRQGLSVRGCGALNFMFFPTLDVGAAYRFPVYEGPILSLGLGPGAGVHWFYDTMSGPLVGWSTDAFASFEAVWWSDMIGFQAQMKAGAMWLHDLAPEPDKALDRWYPIVDLTIGVAFRTPS